MNVSRFVSCQDEYSLVVRDIEKDLLPAAQQYNLGLLPFFPLASGLLTGKYKRGAAPPDDTRFGKAPALRDRYVTPRNEDIVEKLQAFAQARGHSMLELAFSWLASRPQVASVIAGATRVEQIEQNVKAIELDAERGGEGGDRRDHEGVVVSSSLPPFFTGRGFGVRGSPRRQLCDRPVPPHPDRKQRSDLSPQAGRG